VNKNLGTTVGAVALAAVLFRPTGPISAPHDHGEVHSAAAEQHAGKKSSGEGPWVASCNYWEAISGAEPVSGEEPTFSLTLDKKANQLTGSLPGAAEDAKTDCGDDLQGRWGLPDSKAKPEVKALIAVVPDPVRTNMALQFDRTIDALLAAAGDYGYVSSYYWLPWKEHGESAKTSEGEGQGNAAKNIHEPGLIVFKCAQDTQKKTSCSHNGWAQASPFSPPADDFARVIYLFLVGETPTTGIDSFQIHNAFRYQDELEKAGTVLGRSTAEDSRNLAIIGPTFSGSAASLRQAIDTMLAKHPEVKAVSVNGATSTGLAVDQLNPIAANSNSLVTGQKIEYKSFTYDATYDQQCLLGLLSNTSSASNHTNVAFLIEDGTAYGFQATAHATPGGTTPAQQSQTSTCPANQNVNQITIRFPREISLLRNAQAEQGSRREENPAGSAPSPYLHFSLKDSNASDSIPHLSRDNTPLSQEAQLMTIARQLQRYRAQYIAISGSNILDLLFLAQFLHRACPDAKLVFYVGDLLFEREIDNVPFIGTITFTPYPLFSTVSSDPGGTGAKRAFSDSNTEAYYNAASYTFWDDPSKTNKTNPNDPCTLPLMLAGYRNMQQPPLLVTAIGGDGYYPIGIASPKATNNASILPPIPCAKADVSTQKVSSVSFQLPNYPERLWRFLCLAVLLLSAVHSIALCIADYWSPLTRELAVAQNDQPWRRAMYIQIGSAMLFCMVFVVATPPLSTFKLAPVDRPALLLSGCALAMGFLSVVIAFWKTWGYIGWPGTPKKVDLDSFRYVYFIFNLIAWITLLSVPLLWVYLCNTNYLEGMLTKVGLFFSYRCIHPGSGVSPLVPVLILTFSWYLWAVFQTLRLRFSEYSRPRLPGSLTPGKPHPLFVADEDLTDCFGNITCLMISRRILRRIIKGALKNDIVDILLVVAYLVVLVLFVYFAPVRSLDAFFWVTKGRPTPYQLLVTLLFFPLLFIVISSWLRMILVWESLKRDLLERLENLPIRFAFSRLKATGRVTTMRQSGLREQWRDMARSTESIRQMVNCDCIRQINASSANVPHVDLSSVGTEGPKPSPLTTISQALDLWALLEQKRSNPKQNLSQAESKVSNTTAPGVSAGGTSRDFPHGGDGRDLAHMFAMQKYYAEFSEILLSYVLVPHWKKCGNRTVASTEKRVSPEDSPCIRAAEEFLAIRYLALIRAVLANLRQLMMFVSLSFVLAIVAWNSYPFQPRVFINWVFTGMLAILGGGIIWVLAQVHRDPVLSRITHTKANELGLEFYIRIITFGAVPVLTWLAYQFPEVGSTIFKFLQPGLEVVK
jgi:hypothetical protein